MVPENKAAIVEKIILVDKYLSELGEVRGVNFNQYQKNVLVRRGVERLLQLLVEVASDINGMLLSEMGERPPSSYYDSFIRVGRSGLFNEKMAKNLAATAGLRNRLVHEYGEYKDIIVYKNIKLFLQLYSLYIGEIKSYMRKSV